ncbi:metallophosphoesterase [Lachnoclostridium sp. Marseille-P6806]|uniref:metallophosphoesterase n=1 Tax=Lachnoclostridium sp. Marseille-P6806 TaxID=2364793 RepID=UPI0013EF21FA|nr:metallophosphoesterase [Lachnoclostridium sp. Marseille-P6806]
MERVLPALICLALLVTAAFVFLLRGSRRFLLREYRIRSPKLKGEHCFVFLSDLHSRVYGDGNREVVSAIREIHPDAVLVGGDMIVGAFGDCSRSDWYAAAAKLLRDIAAEFPVFCANGNHELRLETPRPGDRFDGGCYKIYERCLAEAGIRISRNERRPLSDLTGNPADQELALYSFEPDIEKYRKFRRHTIPSSYVQERIAAHPEDGFRLVLSHHPKHFDAVACWGADLVLSGHIHGGILRLPRIGGVISPDPELFPRYSGGLYALRGEQISARAAAPEEECRPAGARIFPEHGARFPRDGAPEVIPVRNGGELLLSEDGFRSAMVLSRGLGMHTIPVRVCNTAEISVIRLLPE